MAKASHLLAVRRRVAPRPDSSTAAIEGLISRWSWQGASRIGGVAEKDETCRHGLEALFGCVALAGVVRQNCAVSTQDCPERGAVRSLHARTCTSSRKRPCRGPSASAVRCLGAQLCVLARCFCGASSAHFRRSCARLPASPSYVRGRHPIGKTLDTPCAVFAWLFTCRSHHQPLSLVWARPDSCAH